MLRFFAIIPCVVLWCVFMIKNYQHYFSRLPNSMPKPSSLYLAIGKAWCGSLYGVVTLTGVAFSPVSYAENLPTDVGVTQNPENVENNLSNAVVNTALNEVVTTEDITLSPTMSRVASPKIDEKSARTRPNFTPNEAQERSLQRLKQHYQIHPENLATNVTADDNQADKPATKLMEFGKNLSDNLLGKPQKPAMCHGAWVYPTPTSKTQNTAQQNAQANLPQNSLSNNRQNNDADATLYAEADYGYYDSENYAELVGNVQVNQGSQQINADKVVVNLEDGIALAQGNVMLLQNDEINKNNANNQQVANQFNLLNVEKPLTNSGLISVANEVAYQSGSSKATAKDVAFASVPLQAHGYAKQLNKVDESHYEIDDVMFTTCAPENPTWQINAKNLDIDTDTGRGEVYNATFKVKDTPVFYLPYFNFPIDDRRTSGFLLPKVGFSNDGGLAVQTPYYFNLAPNYDATLTPSIFSNRNPMLTGQFRYLTDGFGQGEVTGSFLPNDKEYNDQDRNSLFYQHRWQSVKYPTLSAHALYQYVSDSAYFDDFDTLGIEQNQLNLPRRIQANYYNDYLTALAKVEAFQTLDNNLEDGQAILDKDKPYQRLPQLSIQYRLPFFDNVDVRGVSDFAYFKRPIDDNSAPEQSGGRLYNKISASYPIKRTWGYITPTASLQHLYTQYDEESTIANNYSEADKSQSIFVPEFSLDAGLNFYKAGTPFGKLDKKWGGYQLISPRLKYVYSPYRDQSDVPNFNTRLASLNFPQMYENSWFLGYDRLADNNHLTPSINYRYIDINGLTRLDASIGQQFYFNDIRVHLANNNLPLAVNSSGTVLQISSQPHQDVWVDLDGAVNDDGNLHYYNAQIRYQPNNNALYNIGMIKRQPHPMGQQALSAVTASAIFPISQNWGFLGAVQYDHLKNRYNDVLAGFTYENCCYGFSVYGRSYYNELDNDNKRKQAIMAKLSLNSIFNKRDGKLSSMINDRVQGFNQLNRFF